MYIVRLHLNIALAEYWGLGCVRRVYEVVVSVMFLLPLALIGVASSFG
jgi:hypothetical protein